MNSIEVNVRLSHYTSNAEPHHGARLEIVDELSHMRIITVTLSPEQVYKLISNQEAKGIAEVLDPEHYEQRVGNKYVHEVVKLGEEFEKSIRMEREVNKRMRNLAEFERLTRGYQGYSWRLHNYGWSLSLWKYEAPGE